MAYDILFNGKNTSGFLEDIDRITFNIKKDLNDSIELENPSKEQIDEIEQIINNLCLDLIAKKSFIEYKCIKEGSQPNVDTFVSEVVEKVA